MSRASTKDRTHPNATFSRRTDARQSPAFQKFKAKLDEAASLAPWIVHDLRRTFVSGGAKLRFPVAVIERCLNHTSGTFRLYDGFRTVWPSILTK